jgi:hypothetical protein
MGMKTNDLMGWHLPRRAPITETMIDRAIAAEEAAAAREHHARAVWFDRAHDAIMVLLTDGRVFGAERSRIPSLVAASQRQLRTLQPTQGGAFLSLGALDLHISVDGLVTSLLEESTSTIRRSAARLAGSVTSSAKASASAKNGRLGGRPRKTQRDEPTAA